MESDYSEDEAEMFPSIDFIFGGASSRPSPSDLTTSEDTDGSIESEHLLSTQKGAGKTQEGSWNQSRLRGDQISHINE